VLANIYPFWEGMALPRAVLQLQRSYQRLKAAAGGKDIMISETGWPTCGQPIGAAVPSAHNASVYFQHVVSWARDHGIALFYFESFDEPWKIKHEGRRGACWGIWDAAGAMKPGMQRVFDGEGEALSGHERTPPTHLRKPR
jgi:exo-beta-1,3-glucanase (GH17 family)